MTTAATRAECVKAKAAGLITRWQADDVGPARSISMRHSGRTRGLREYNLGMDEDITAKLLQVIRSQRGAFAANLMTQFALSAEEMSQATMTLLVQGHIKVGALPNASTIRNLYIEFI
jgi:hypothetical protein